MISNEITPNDSLTNIDNGSLLSDEGGNRDLAVAAFVQIQACNVMNIENTPNDSFD